MNIVILAAGQGKRMRSTLPKVLHPLAGKPLLRHVVDCALQLAPERLIVVYGHEGEEVQKQMADVPNLVWALQAERLGTGHALMQAVPCMLGQTAKKGQVANPVDPSEYTLVLYGDVPLIQVETLQGLIEAAIEQPAGAAILTTTLDDPTGYGRIVRDHAGMVSCVVEEKDASLAQKEICEINTGVMVLPTARLVQWLDRLENNNAQSEYYLTDVIALAVDDKLSVCTASPQASWETEGVNDKRQLAALERIWQHHQADQLLLEGVSLADPARLDVRGNLSCGTDVVIDVGCVFEGDVQLGDQVQIGPYCYLKDVQIDAGVHVLAFSHLEDTHVGAMSSIGPYARLRPGTVLGQKTRVGNFVEIKNTRISDSSKVNHLSYIGDARIGQNVNVGAGTITCNYDGAKKHQTLIEDNVFIGSGSQLVAPIKIGDGATLGAGTTLRAEAPAGALVTTRIKQKNHPGWKRPTKAKPSDK